jgi:F0F1-type ATP synthase alpha subunit
MLGEIIKIPTTKGVLFGQALNLNADETTDVVLFGDETLLKAADSVYRTKELLKVTSGIYSLGKVINSLGVVVLSSRIN